MLFTYDADFKEEDHPRRDDGKFGTGSGGGKKPSTTKPKSKSAETSGNSVEELLDKGLSKSYDTKVLKAWQSKAPKIFYHGSPRKGLTTLAINSPAAHGALGGGSHVPTLYLTDDPKVAKSFGENVYEIHGVDPSRLYPDPEVIPSEKNHIEDDYSAVMYTQNIPATEYKQPEPTKAASYDLSKARLVPPGKNNSVSSIEIGDDPPLKISVWGGSNISFSISKSAKMFGSTVDYVVGSISLNFNKTNPGLVRNSGAGIDWSKPDAKQALLKFWEDNGAEALKKASDRLAADFGVKASYNGKVPLDKIEAIVQSMIKVFTGAKDADLGVDGVINLDAPRFTFDADFKEEDHPRGKGGKFTKGAGQSGSAPKKETGEEPKEASEGGKVEATKPTKASGKVAAKEAQYKGIDGIASYLGMVGKMMSAQSARQGMSSLQEFVLKNGYPYTVNEKTFEGKRAPMHECYKNATIDSLNNPDHTYVEGYVSVHGIPIAHAWTVDKSGQVYDNTITPDEHIDGYFGVPFSSDYVLKSILKNKVYGVLEGGGFANETLPALLKGEVKDFKQPVDLDAISDDVVRDRLNYAERTSRSIEPTDKIDTPERRELRKKIINDLYNKDIANRKRDRELTIVLGLPASGKSSLAGPIIKEKGALELDPDLAKAELPEYQNGIGAFATHEESSAITREIMAEALRNGDNIVWPRVDSPDKVIQDIKNLKRLGYKVDVKHLEVTPEVAEKSAVDRYLTSGRYVSPLVVREYGTKPLESYKAVQASGLADSTEMFKREYVRGRHADLERVEE